MTDIMQKDWPAYWLVFPGLEISIPLILQCIECSAHEIHSSKRMVKTCMKCARINQVGKPKLLYSSKTLKITMLDDVKNEIVGYIDESVNRIIKNFLFVQQRL